MISELQQNALNPKIASIINSIKNGIIIKKNGIIFLLMKIYLIVPDELKNLIQFKNILYIYYPIKNSDFLLNKNVNINNKHNKYKICLNKNDIIEEVKSFLGIHKNSTNYNFDFFNQKLGILKNDYELSKTDNINYNIIYLKIKLNKDNSKIRSYNDVPNIPNMRRMIKFKNKKSKLIEYIMGRPKRNNSQLNLRKLINETVSTINSQNKTILDRNYSSLSRNISVRKYNPHKADLTTHNSNRIDKNTTTDDLAHNNILNGKKMYKYNNINMYNNKNSLINLKNNNYYAKDMYRINLSKKNLSSLDYYINNIERKPELSQHKHINRYKMIRSTRNQEILLESKNFINLSIANKMSYPYQNRKKFVKSLFKNNISNKNKKKNLRFSQPNIIKSYLEVFKHNLNNNKVKNEDNE